MPKDIWMDNKEFSKRLEARTKKFAISIIKLSSSLPNTPEGKVIRNQITKSGSSIGANYRKQIGQEAKLIIKIKLRYVKVKRVNQFFGLR